MESLSQNLIKRIKDPDDNAVIYLMHFSETPDTIYGTMLATYKFTQFEHVDINKNGRINKLIVTDVLDYDLKKLWPHRTRLYKGRGTQTSEEVLRDELTRRGFVLKNVYCGKNPNNHEDIFKERWVRE